MVVGHWGFVQYRWLRVGTKGVNLIFEAFSRTYLVVRLKFEPSERAFLLRVRYPSYVRVPAMTRSIGRHNFFCWENGATLMFLNWDRLSRLRFQKVYRKKFANIREISKYKFDWLGLWDLWFSSTHTYMSCEWIIFSGTKHKFCEAHA